MGQKFTRKFEASVFPKYLFTFHAVLFTVKKTKISWLIASLIVLQEHNQNMVEEDYPNLFENLLD